MDGLSCTRIFLHVILGLVIQVPGFNNIDRKFYSDQQEKWVLRFPLMPLLLDIDRRLVRKYQK